MTSKERLALLARRMQDRAARAQDCARVLLKVGIACEVRAALLSDEYCEAYLSTFDAGFLEEVLTSEDCADATLNSRGGSG